MGRKPGHTISELHKQRMQDARKRKKMGYTRHLRAVKEMVRERIDRLFERWDIYSDEVHLFKIYSMDGDENPINQLQYEKSDLDQAIDIAVESLKKREVREVGIDSGHNKVLAKTENTGWLIFIKKVGLEYLVETHQQWTRGEEKQEGEVKTDVKVM